MNLFSRIALGAMLFSTVFTVTAAALSNVSINGRTLSLQELAALQYRIGTPVVPGNYLYNANNGCWINLSTRQSGCLGASNTAYPRNGGAGQSGNRDWSYNSGVGGWVGGSADGCIYTETWSNC